MKKGRLILVPSALADENAADHFPAASLIVIMPLRHFITERARTARRFLRSIGFDADFDTVGIQELDKHQPDDVERLLTPCMQGHDVGLLSEAGVPGVADPGGIIVRAAHHKGIQVQPLIGASSLLLALMGSGMNGQSFQFHGYLPREEQALSKAIRGLELTSRQQNTTILFIETPYRNDKTFQSLLKNLQPTTDLCLATQLTASDESIRTMSVGEWKKSKHEIGKKPTVFLLFSGVLES